MMSLITSTDEIKQYLVTDASFRPENVLPYIDLAKPEIIRILGDPQYSELLSYYLSGSTSIPELNDLLPVVQRPLFYFAFLKGLDNFNVSIGQNGIAVVSNTHLAPASSDRVEKLRKSTESLAYDSLENLLIFLEENKDDYPLWESSESYVYQHQFLIQSARAFDEIFHIDRSRYAFIQQRPVMYDMEFKYIAPEISPEFLQELKDQLSAGNVSSANKVVLPLLQKALAYLTMGRSIPDLFKEGIFYLRSAKKILDGKPDDYPTYAASSVFIESSKSYTPIENDENHHLAFFG